MDEAASSIVGVALSRDYEKFKQRKKKPPSLKSWLGRHRWFAVCFMDEMVALLFRFHFDSIFAWCG